MLKVIEKDNNQTEENIISSKNIENKVILNKNYSTYATHPIDTLYNEIYGMSDIVKDFINSMHKSQLHHGWLIHGFRGAGKASIAIRLAYIKIVALSYTNISSINDIEGASINIEKLIHDTQSGALFKNYEELALHKQFVKLQHPDFLFISSMYEINSLENKKTKENISIDEIRYIKNKLYHTPGASKYRVIVIDGVDAMNYNASNALLKILEEPNENIFFILIAHNISKVPATVRSRCKLKKTNMLKFEDFNKALMQSITNSNVANGANSGNNISKYTDQQMLDIFHLSQGNISLSTLLMKMPLEEIDLILSKILNGMVDRECIVKLKQYVDMEEYYNIIVTLLYNKIRNRILKVGLKDKNNDNDFCSEKESDNDSAKLIKSLDNFYKVRQFINNSKRLNLDMSSVIASISGI